jgi:hypothetical protein
MPKKITWDWLEPRLPALNAKWLESQCGMYRGKINDVKRGKVKLTETELQAVKKALLLFK